ncbi:DUF4169 family protein [Roseibium sp. RKSG952]|uniref:DUF4169 family protein n=1 Tax=Roseibium sp. RKSG952 TaxID=2529384 RepID=UPI0012BC7529|nr:DUF4169 family protein [Roseibium sp. RKSG952]MTH96739.1 DUF4169 family protein [Roseibium sp. RKSG952]
MSAEIINLRQTRKRKARADKDKQAEKNRLKFGRTKAERQLEDAERAKLEGHVDGHRIDGGDTSGNE